jgi:PIN domain nuclease of toxin-antitoxin system
MQATIQGGDPIFVPTICLVEVIYLVEKDRLPASALELIYSHVDEPDSGIELVPLDRGVVEALSAIPREQVPDMPDRIIAATALHLGLPLVSRDPDIRSSGIELVW